MTLRFGTRRLSFDRSFTNRNDGASITPLPEADDRDLVYYSRGPERNFERARDAGLTLVYGGHR